MSHTHEPESIKHSQAGRITHKYRKRAILYLYRDAKGCKLIPTGIFASSKQHIYITKSVAKYTYNSRDIYHTTGKIPYEVLAKPEVDVRFYKSYISLLYQLLVLHGSCRVEVPTTETKKFEDEVRSKTIDSLKKVCKEKKIPYPRDLSITEQQGRPLQIGYVVYIFSTKEPGFNLLKHSLVGNIVDQPPGTEIRGTIAYSLYNR